MYDLALEFIGCMAAYGAILLALAVGCLIADYILPYIRPIERYLESLPDFENDETL